MHTVLICEDEELERLALRKMLERNYPTMQVLEEAKTGTEAIRKAKLYMPTLILMDIKMPEMSGLLAQKEILKFHPQIKTIIITAHDNFSYAHEAIKYKIYDYLLKPFSPAMLYSCIDKVLLETTSGKRSFEEQSLEEKSRIKEALSYIDEHYLDTMQLSDVAERVGLSEKYFSRYFKMQTGYSFTDYLNLQRINRAKSLLLYTTVPIYKIAIDLNFSDSSYFIKVFQKHEKITPSQFRQKHKLHK
ncbi:MAG: response regulator [Sporomusaceae bacterium]|nr:response regulator [Sporomusaceae bacterium]